MQVVRTACMLAVLATVCHGAATGRSSDGPKQPEDRMGEAPPADKRLGLGIINSVASASASLSGASSGASSDHHTAYGPPVETYDGKDFNFWTFKKELLRSLFQIVKALKGGVLALKGHLLKTKGNLLATKGHMLAAKGEAIKNVGKSIAANAFSSSHPPSGGYGPPSGYPASGQPSGYAASGAGGAHLSYSGPPPPVHPQPISSSGFGGSFSSPSHLFPAGDLARVANTATGGDKGKTLPEGATAGLLILKPVNLPAKKGKSLAGNADKTDIGVESTNIDFSLLPPHPDLFMSGFPYYY